MNRTAIFKAIVCTLLILLVYLIYQIKNQVPEVEIINKPILIDTIHIRDEEIKNINTVIINNNIK